MVPLYVQRAPCDEKKNNSSIDILIFIVAILVGYGEA